MDIDKQMQKMALRLLQKNEGQLDADECVILEKFANRTPVSRDLSDQTDGVNFWDNLADKVAAVGGSWSFIFGFLALLLAWMLLNTEILSAWKLAFDPYPYIFLNLMLSMVAALQAPVIMMSQNRQAARDRIAAQHDYEVNLKAELEIMALHEKWDQGHLSNMRRMLDDQSKQIASIISLLDHKAS